MNRTELEVVIILCSGIGLSTLGYLLMLLTAALFPPWRRNVVNQVWMHMCGLKLIAGYMEMLYQLWRYHCIPLPWMTGNVGVKAHSFLGNYVFLASCSWMASGAWLAYRKLVTVFPNAVDSSYFKKVSLFSWLAPLPVCIACYVLMLTLVIYFVYVTLMILVSVCLYCRVLYTVSRSARDCGRRRDLLGKTVLAVMFVLTSGVQYAVIIVNKYVTDLTSEDSGQCVMFKVKLFVVCYNVSLYSMLFVFGIKQTRILWTRKIGIFGRRENSENRLEMVSAQQHAIDEQ